MKAIKAIKKLETPVKLFKRCVLSIVVCSGVMHSSMGFASGESNRGNTSKLTSETVSYTQGQVEINDNAFNSLSYAKASDSTAQNNHTTMRLMALKSIALRIGQQYGYAKQLQYLQDQITSKAPSLDQVFNFNFILSYANRDSPAINIVPPVILKASDFVQQDNLASITIADVHYVIYRNVQIVTTVPSWRDYLIKAIAVPEVVSDSILPKDDNESQAWQQNIQLGWQLGIKQANQEMTYRINQLSRDFNGMVLYLMLYRQGKVNAPDVAYLKQSVVGDGSSMSVNQQVYRLKTQSEFISDPTQWSFTPQTSLGGEKRVSTNANEF
ncbi:type IV secretory system conjugative DNA transfer family protein [Cysteiniphilum marinum]|uniref:type IV secretory system conjugative DNA transfer family protein n=1 Tax=Cysteiniphilum marinum TaxID=2774191 RepID=UPI001939D9E8|nr:type IV secretory system conjugative DNA transfer family protein [Cysteiniphilum marinum]